MVSTDGSEPGGAAPRRHRRGVPGPVWLISAVVLVTLAGLLALATSTEGTHVAAAPATSPPATGAPVPSSGSPPPSDEPTTTAVPEAPSDTTPAPAADDDGPPPVLRPQGTGGSTGSDVPLVRHQVTATTYTFVDTSRPTPPAVGFTGYPSRTLPTTVWFPATPGAYPLVVFAHGYASNAAFYTNLLTEIASYGYVVAAPEFPLTSRAQTSYFVHDDVLNQPGDLSFVITQLLSLNQGGGNLAGRILRSRVAVMGHSDGGLTAVATAYNACCQDPRVHAAVILSGQASGFGPVWFPAGSPPMLAVHGTADTTNPLNRSLTLFAAAPSPKFLLEVVGGSHDGPFTNDPVRPLVSAVIVDFLQAELQGNQAAANRLPVDGNVDGKLQLQFG